MNRIARRSSAVGGQLRFLKVVSAAFITLAALTTTNSMTHAQTVNTIYSFPGNSGGARPDGALLVDASGNLYGTTSSGGNNRSNGGIAFKLSPFGGGWSENVLFQFLEILGDEPTSALVAYRRGNLYGTTPVAGSYRDGVVVQLGPKANGAYQYASLHLFTPRDTHSRPSHALI